MADGTIKRENIAYLICDKCGVVFPDRDNPVNCPICEADKSHFTEYHGNRS